MDKTTSTNSTPLKSPQSNVNDQTQTPVKTSNILSPPQTKTINQPSSPKIVNTNNITHSKDGDGHEKIPLKFDLPPSSAVSPEMCKILTELKSFMETESFMWGDFPIRLPDSKIQHTNDESEDDSLISMDTLFPYPTLFDVNEETLGSVKGLTEHQLREIRQKGQFSVDSVKFPGKKHIWKLSKLLQKGSDNIIHTGRESLAQVIDQIFYRIPDRIYSNDCFNVVEGIKWIFRGIYDIPDVLFGLPTYSKKYQTHEVNMIVNEARKNYIMNDLKEISPNVYETSEKVRINFKLPVLMRQHGSEIRVTLSQIYSATTILWERERQSVKVKLLRHIRSEKRYDTTTNNEPAADLVDNESENDVIVEELAERMEHEFNKRVINSVYESKKLSEIDEDLPLLICQHLRTYIIYKEIENRYNRELDKKKQEISDNIKLNYPTLSLVSTWFNERLNSEIDLYVSQLTPINDLFLMKLEGMKDLTQPSYLLRKTLEFNMTEGDRLKKTLLEEHVPSRVFRFKNKIWLPKNWVIEKNYLYGPNSSEPLKEVYTAHKHTYIEVPTSIPGWRLANVAARIYTWMRNITYYALAINLFNGPFSFRALFGKNAFYPAKKVNNLTGDLEVNTSIKIETFRSLFLILRNHISQSRSKFESSPDNGFIGKTVTRWFNMGWNYIFKGFFGSLILIVGFPLISVGNILITLLFLLATPIWVPLLSFSRFAYSYSMYDLDSPYASTQWKLFPLLRSWIKLFIYGFGQILLSLFTGTVIHPLLATLISVFGVFRTIFRVLYDWFIYHLIIKSRARVPTGDSFLARRIHGPGLSSVHYFQIDSNTALLALMLHLEQVEINVYEMYTLYLINQPDIAFRNLQSSIFTYFGFAVDHSSPVWQKIQERNKQIREELNKKLEAYRSQMKSACFSREVRQSLHVLSETTQKGVRLVQNFVPTHIFKYFSDEQKTQFWSSVNLMENDWEGLTKHYLSEVFGREFLEPLEEADNTFMLKIEHVDVPSLVSSIFKGVPQDDLESAILEATHLGHRRVKTPVPHLNDLTDLLHHPGRNLSETVTTWTTNKNSDI
eukprot:TRINITY_DN6275_c0_g1_i1.p1 TRINITY_DN6275_c0_g1~~TRINITY_DN6275_c0_g1_i1.p1  ORF type:complete len:1065 (-),score=168.01 TRINITY_DN6275_c0_g1_i1:56-3250(-)